METGFSHVPRGECFHRTRSSSGYLSESFRRPAQTANTNAPTALPALGLGTLGDEVFTEQFQAAVTVATVAALIVSIPAHPELVEG